MKSVVNQYSLILRTYELISKRHQIILPSTYPTLEIYKKNQQEQKSNKPHNAKKRLITQCAKIRHHSTFFD